MRIRLVAAIAVLLVPGATHQAAADPRTASPRIAPYVGEWAGVAWGWEVRFRRTRSEFASQFTTQKLPGGPAAEGEVMSLTVQHAAEILFTVNSAGQVEGHGVVAYRLVPNLCGVQVLTQQVNQAVNLMEWLELFYSVGKEISKHAVERFNRNLYEEEAKLAELVNELVATGHEYLDAGKITNRKKWLQFQRDKKAGLAKDPDVRQIVQAIIYNRCANPRYRIVGGLTCEALFGAPIAAQATGTAKVAWDAGMDVVIEVLGNQLKDKIVALDLQHQREEAVCSGAVGLATRAGTKVGPSNRREMILEMLGNAGEAAVDVATAGAPVGLVLSLPGVTQVQYNYKGLANGPEVRRFKVTGHVEPSGNNQAKLYLQMDGDVLGEKNLFVEWQVNYKTERAPFPTWSPFLSKPGQAQPSGIVRIGRPKTQTRTREFVDAASGKKKTATYTVETTVFDDVAVRGPTAVFYEQGAQRNGVKFWHDYEYMWNVHKITEPPLNDADQATSPEPPPKSDLE